MASFASVQRLLVQIYGPEDGARTFERIRRRLNMYPRPMPGGGPLFSEKTIVMITYGDTLQSASGTAPLQILTRFAQRYLKGVFSAIHLLPFFPYSSDDGFSVQDYHAVRSDLGTWEDIAAIGRDFDLMFDFVLNHVSAQSRWFENYLKGARGYEHLAVEMPPQTDLSAVVRPRSLPLLTPFTKKSGERVHLWTTFGPDQIDLNYADPAVLERMIDVLLDYIRRGAAMLRLDAVGYLWKCAGTPSIHLPQTHAVVRLIRAILDIVAPHVLLITETNVPHAENIRYFGDGGGEAQMVYNFTLPPLLLYSLLREDATLLSAWVKTLTPPSDRCTFFNFTASHDGIGVRPLEGILPGLEIDRLAEQVEKNGGLISYKRNSDGSESPYELNTTYIDALGRSADGPADRRIDRFLASQAIQLVLPGVPGVYIHSVLGSRNWRAGVKMTGRARSINREKLDVDAVSDELAHAASFRARVFQFYRRMIRIRAAQPAFAPGAAASVLAVDPGVFGLMRRTGSQRIYALTNLTSRRLRISLAGCRPDVRRMTDLLSNEVVDVDRVGMPPWASRWLTQLPNRRQVR